MIHGLTGCASNGELLIPLAVDVAAQRCQSLDARDLRALGAWTPAPKVSTDQPLTAKAVQQWIDRYRLSEYRKNKAAERLIQDYRECSGQAVQVAAKAGN